MTTRPNDAETANDRVRAALDGTFSPSDLEEDEQAIFFELLGQRRAGGTRSESALALLREAGNVGYDEAGNLVKTLGGGEVKILKHPD